MRLMVDEVNVTSITLVKKKAKSLHLLVNRTKLMLSKINVGNQHAFIKG